jgi:hypothetical protein
VENEQNSQQIGLLSPSEIENQTGILKYKMPLPKIMKKYQTQYASFEGAVIDLESDGGPFLNYLMGAYRYSKHQATSFAILDKNYVEVIAKTCQASDNQFIREVEALLDAKSRPFYAFNAEFDMALLSNLLHREIIFDRDIMVEKIKKELQVKNLKINNFDDPFNGDGAQAGFSWKKHLETKDNKHVHNIIAHNCACVLKEYSLLLLNGFKPIESNSCNDFFDGKNCLFFGCQEKLAENKIKK